jgi:hypothetical protein
MAALSGIDDLIISVRQLLAIPIRDRVLKAGAQAQGNADRASQTTIKGFETKTKSGDWSALAGGTATRIFGGIAIIVRAHR